MRRFALYSLLLGVIFATAVASAPAGVTVVSTSKSSQVVFGVSDLEKALAGSKAAGVTITVTTGAKGLTAEICRKAGAKLPSKPESFVIARTGKNIAVVGSDDTGTMYGLFELAERLQMDGAKALELKKPVLQSPYVEFRAVNPFLTLPYGDENNWWFLSDDFWKGYIDMLARARINWIDLHGMYDIKTTWFPNIYPYFIKSNKFPEAGAPPEVADKNLAMLNKVIKMAKSRGIKFAIMSYSATWKGPGLRQNPYEETEENLAEYTRECVRKMIQSCPELEMIGFRIGESGKSEEFFRNSYIPAIKEAGKDIDLYTRSWGASKSRVMEIGEAFPGRLYCEIKYNGEQYGPAHMIAGGRMMGWKDYSYQEYFTYPRNYKVIWQVRQNGTHRVFPWGNPKMAAMTARNSHLGGSIGFCTEPINGYYPAYDYLHPDDSPCKWYKWVYQRDWFFYDVWGRMSYDTNVSDRVWISKFKKRYGAKAGESFYKAFTTASLIVPYAKTFYSLGPDHRNHAPELETGGNVDHWARDGGFDTQNVQSPAEYAKNIVENTPSARLNPMQAADILTRFSTDTRKNLELATKQGSSSKEFQCLSQDMEALADLADYYAARLKSATNYSLYSITRVPRFADLTRHYHAEAVAHWTALASVGDSHYKPFVDTLKMKTEQFRWSEEGKKLTDELWPLDQLDAAAPMDIALDVLEPKGDKTGPKVEISKVDLTASREGRKTLSVYAKINDPAGVKSVLLKYKAFPSEAPWKTMEMKQVDSVWTASVSVLPQGLLWCIEALDKDNNGTMWPDFRVDIPYRMVEPWNETDRVVSSIDAALDEIFSSKSGMKKYSALLIGRNSTSFGEVSQETKAKILEAVEAGATLVIDHQDYPFDLSWLPGEIEIVKDKHDLVKLDTSHPILKGMSPEMKRNRRWGLLDGSLTATDPEWQFITEPKSIAIRKHGNGRIIIIQLARNDRLGDPIATMFMDNISSFACGTSIDSPILVLDQGDGDIISRLQALNVMLVRCGK